MLRSVMAKSIWPNHSGLEPCCRLRATNDGSRSRHSGESRNPATFADKNPGFPISRERRGRAINVPSTTQHDTRAMSHFEPENRRFWLRRSDIGTRHGCATEVNGFWCLFERNCTTRNITLAVT